MRHLKEELVVVHVLLDVSHVANDELPYMLMMSKFAYQAAGLVHVVMDVVFSFSVKLFNLLRVFVVLEALLHRHGDARKMSDPIINVTVHGLQRLAIYYIAVVPEEKSDRSKVGETKSNGHEVI